MAYWTQTDLENLIGVETVRALFDDNNDGVADAAPIALVQKMSDAPVNGALATEYPGTYPLPNPPDIVFRASLLFGKAYSFQRRPEYVKQYGDGPMTEAKAALEFLVTSREYMIDVLSGQVTQKPANTGGAVVDGASRIYVDSPGGPGGGNAGDF